MSPTVDGIYSSKYWHKIPGFVHKNFVICPSHKQFQQLTSPSALKTNISSSELFPAVSIQLVLSVFENIFKHKTYNRSLIYYVEICIILKT